MSAVYTDVPGPIQELPGSVMTGDGTFFPFGMSMARYFESVINTKEWLITSDYETGPTTLFGVRPAYSLIPSGFNLTGVPAAFYDGTVLQYQTGTASAFILLDVLFAGTVSGLVFWKRSDGLIYPALQIRGSDPSMGRTSTTSNNSGSSIGMVTWLDCAPVNLYADDPTNPPDPCNVQVDQNAAFP